MTMEQFSVCPICRGQGTVTPHTVEEAREVRGEEFVVQAEYFHCSQCESEFEPEEGETGLTQARVKYRAKYDMVQPQQLAEWRKALDISQSDLAAILGWGTATVSRYENGKLQEAAHDKEMRLAMKSPENLLELVRAAKDLGEKTRDRLVRQLSSELTEARAAEQMFLRKAKRAPSETIDIRKLANLVVLLCERSSPFLTKLNKLLFYVDFKSVKSRGVTVSGLTYYRFDFGPVPSAYSSLYRLLEERGEIELIEANVGNHDGLKVQALVESDRNLFAEDELAIVLDVKARFAKLTSKELSDLSHEELAWKETPPQELISFDHAGRLSI